MCKLDPDTVYAQSSIVKRVYAEIETKYELQAVQPYAEGSTFKLDLDMVYLQSSLVWRGLHTNLT